MQRLLVQVEIDLLLKVFGTVDLATRFYKEANNVRIEDIHSTQYEMHRKKHLSNTQIWILKSCILQYGMWLS